MSAQTDADRRLRGVFRLLITACVILGLMSSLLWFAQQRQQEAISLALKMRAHLWLEHQQILQQRWRLQQKPAHWKLEGQWLLMSASGWPMAGTSEDCRVLWQVLLSEAPSPLIQQIQPLATGCRYQTEKARLEYDYLHERITFSAIEQ